MNMHIFLRNWKTAALDKIYKFLVCADDVNLLSDIYISKETRKSYYLSCVYKKSTEK
jgi:hypothetical protein